MKLKRHIRYPISTIFMILGYILGFAAMFNGLSIYDYCVKYENDANNNQYKYSKEIYITSMELDEAIDLTPVLNSKKYIYSLDVQVPYYINDTDTYTMGDALLNTNEETNYCMLEGRLPDYEEISQGKQVIAIGKALKNYTYMQDGKTYINIYSVPYEVVGIIGTGISDSQDNEIVTYYQCLDGRTKEKVNMTNMCITVASNADQINTSDIEEYYKKDGSVNIEVSEGEELSGTMLNDERIRANFYVMAFIFCVVNCMVICEFWIYQRRREFAVRKAYGYSSRQIVKLVAWDMLKTITVSCVLGYVFQVIVMYIMGEYDVYFGLSVLNILKVIALILCTTIISISIPVIKVIKRRPVLEISQKGVV